MTVCLLEIHIGPMQVFIAAARRTRDLWFGSWLMSELSKAAARAVADVAGEQNLIFPAASSNDLEPGSELSVANKIVATVENPQAVARQAENALRARLDELAKIALDAAGGPLDTRETAVSQINDLPEFYWTAVPLPGEKNYPDIRKKAENLLAARKNLRNFSQPTWSSNRPKSSLDGNRESVIPADVSGDAQEMYKRYKAKAGEQLSGVDLLKRLGKRSKNAGFESFPSVSHMAAMPLREKLANGDAKAEAAWKAYTRLLPLELKNTEQIPKKERIEKNRHPVFEYADGALLFESRLRDYYGQKTPDKVTKALQDFYEAAERPLPYYALLVGDGDFMGRVINNQKTREAHYHFSKTLAGFAAGAKTIVENHQGAVVYAGGDDVMALLPVHKAVQCAAKLAEKFQATMQEFTDKDGRSPTFSAGIAIFHHTEPLEDALQTAREAEQTAKLVKGKNALAITEARRSGAPRPVKGKWGALDKRLLKLAAFFQAGALPVGLAYQLRELYLRLGGAEGLKAQPDLQEAMKKEAGRIVKRKEGTNAAQVDVEEMIARLSDDYTVGQIANELIIATNLARAADQAGLDLAEESTGWNGG
ncbi:MAG TPA: type III-B CRISPR-associated protein Cas10/Cmr2 [Anaerolineae bacterium]|nr:type III-B CRISPR-associated protein Cas10/Cmr2 [Anaerolineae bacterium]